MIKKLMSQQLVERDVNSGYLLASSVVVSLPETEVKNVSTKKMIKSGAICKQLLEMQGILH